MALFEEELKRLTARDDELESQIEGLDEEHKERIRRIFQAGQTEVK